MQTDLPVSIQYFEQGEIIGGTAYYYVQDRLGSVSQLITATGSVASQSTFDPYGNRTTVRGTVIPDIGYAGYFSRTVGGLDFTLHRAFDPTHARWINRDPLGKLEESICTHIPIALRLITPIQRDNARGVQPPV